MAGTDEVTSDYPSKTELDFNRLIAKFQISRASTFWRGGFESIPREALYPDNDRIQTLCREIREDVRTGVQASELGSFLQAWASVESRVLTLARTRPERGYSVMEALRVLARSEALPPDLSQRLNVLRKTRNSAVHNPEKLRPGELAQATTEIASILKQLKQTRAPSSDS